MWKYEKMLQYPVKIKTPNPELAKVIITQYGGPDGESGAFMRYISQRYSMPYSNVVGVLTDIATEEVGHMEMVCSVVYQLTRNLSIEDIEKSGFAPYYVDHTTGLYPIAASGSAFSAETFQSTGDPITDLHEDMAAEMKARTTYDNILRLAKDPDVADVIRYLREREIIHYQRFGESLRIVQDHLDSKNFFAFNPSFDCPSVCKD
ncbi:MAG: manganese catalase family protein [Agathobacter sp.]